MYELWSIPERVGIVAHSGNHNLNMLQIDYAAIFRRVSTQDGDWVAALRDGIEQRGVLVNSWLGLIPIATRTTIVSWHWAAFWLPFAASLIYFARHWRRATGRSMRSRRRAPKP